MEPTWHDGLSRKALVELVEGLLLAMDKAVPRLDAIVERATKTRVVVSEGPIPAQTATTRPAASTASSVSTPKLPGPLSCRGGEKVAPPSVERL